MEAQSFGCVADCKLRCNSALIFKCLLWARSSRFHELNEMHANNLIGVGYKTSRDAKNDGDAPK